MRDYGAISLKNDFLHKIDKAIEGHGFTSRAEFIRQAIRNELAKLGG